VQKVITEQTLYKDVVVLTTLNDTKSKAVFGMAWLCKNCNNTLTYTKIEDDILVDYPPFFKYILEEVPKHPNSIHCQKVYNKKLVYCHRHVALFHRDVLRKLVAVVPKVTKTNLVEDQYVYGALRNAAEVNLVDIS